MTNKLPYTGMLSNNSSENGASGLYGGKRVNSSMLQTPHSPSSQRSNGSSKASKFKKRSKSRKTKKSMSPTASKKAK